jgi:Protein of unknown function (DUF3089)
MRVGFLLPVVFIIFLSCSNKYEPFVGNYDFKAESGNPDYSKLDYWAAHPWKKDPSDSIPLPLRDEMIDSTVDVFFLYPTSFTGPFGTNDNAAIDDASLNAKTDYSSILYQASVFNQSCRIFSPRYKQAHISVFYIKDTMRANKAFDIAYSDIRDAFEYYLQHWNKGRPIVIASHSQGSLLAERLLKEFFENKPLYKQLVTAYILGWPVPKDYFSSIKMCNDSSETGCICSWRTLRKGFAPAYMKGEKEVYATNPLTWKTNEQYAPRSMNRGSVLRNFNKVYKHTTDAKVVNGVLFVRKPKFPWGFLYFRKNYHIADFNLFYINIRENVKERVAAYKNK